MDGWAVPFEVQDGRMGDFGRAGMDGWTKMGRVWDGRMEKSARALIKYGGKMSLCPSRRVWDGRMCRSVWGPGWTDGQTKICAFFLGWSALGSSSEYSNRK